VVCLLSEAEARRYDLPEAYAGRFTVEHVPIRDRHLPDPAALDRAVELLEEANYAGERVAIHCNAGLGRTGFVAAAWLTRAHGYEPEGAIEAVEAAGRAPREAVRDGNATETELLALLAGEREPGANPE
jgi:atypical dual specificity phosphatase